MGIRTVPSPFAPVVAAPGADLSAGDLVGDYRIERKLGQGGMGAVYEAVHLLIEKRVAIKVLRRGLCNDDVVARFVQEARAVNRIGHPNIVDVFGFGTADDGSAYLAMELLRGESLAARIDRERLSMPAACGILTEITYALEAAHAHGIVHRDLKPDNVFLAETGDRVVVKLLDFGIAKLINDPEHAPVDYTQPGEIIGTPMYIAPEQARGLPLSGSADVYALGVMTFEVFTGSPPFIGDHAIDLVAKHITQDPPAPSAVDASLPAVADALVLAMLAKTPANRPSLASVRESLHRLEVAACTPPRRTWRAVVAGLAVAAAVVVGVATDDEPNDATVSLRSLLPRAPTPPAMTVQASPRVNIVESPLAAPPTAANIEPPAEAPSTASVVEPPPPHASDAKRKPKMTPHSIPPPPKPAPEVPAIAAPPIAPPPSAAAPSAASPPAPAAPPARRPISDDDFIPPPSLRPPP